MFDVIAMSVYWEYRLIYKLLALAGRFVALSHMEIGRPKRSGQINRLARAETQRHGSRLQDTSGACGSSWLDQPILGASST